MSRRTKERVNQMVEILKRCTTDIELDKAEHNMPETEKYFYRLTKSNN